MGYIKCPACEMEYSESLIKCPYCNTNSPLLTNKIKIVRDNHLVGISTSPKIYLDGAFIGRLISGGVLETYVLPGKHVLQVHTLSDSEKRIVNSNRYEYIIKKSSKLIIIHIELKTYVLKNGEFVVDSVSGL